MNKIFRTIFDFFNTEPKLMSRSAQEEYKKDPQKFVNKEFDKEYLDFFMPDTFKGLSKKYMLEKMFDEEIQQEWNPQVGDIIIGCTGNIFVIGAEQHLTDNLGGTKWFFGGGPCNRDGGCVMDSTYYFTANESGKDIHPIKGELLNYHHSSIREFRYVPYPHEL